VLLDGVASLMEIFSGAQANISLLNYRCFTAITHFGNEPYVVVFTDWLCGVFVDEKLLAIQRLRAHGASEALGVIQSAQSLQTRLQNWTGTSMAFVSALHKVVFAQGLVVDGEEGSV